MRKVLIKVFDHDDLIIQATLPVDEFMSRLKEFREFGVVKAYILEDEN